MSVFVALVRLVLAGVFLFSAVAKLRDRSSSREAVRAFGVPGSLVGTVAAGLPLVELGCAGLLVTADPAATVGAVVSLLVLTAFTVAIVLNLLRGRRPDCHCFGSMGQGGKIGWMTVARNGILMALAGLSLIGTGALPSVPAALAELEGSARGALAAAAVVLGAFAGMGLALYTLMRRYGAVLLRLDTLETATGLAPPPVAPGFALPDLDGDLLTLDDILTEDRPALLVFISPTCVNCAQLLPDLADWQGDSEHQLSVVVISDGSVADNRAKFADAGPLRVLLQDGFATADLYGIQGTPGAVLVGAEGRIAGQAMHGVDGIRSLHQTVVEAMSGGAATDGHGHVHTIGRRPASVGDPLPDSFVVTESGEEVSVLSAVEDEAVLLFWRTNCGFCSSIVDEVRALEVDVPVRLVSASALVDLRESGLSSPVLRDSSGALEGGLQVPGTPSAVRVQAGVLDSALAVGGPDVLALLRASSRSSTATE